MDPGARGPGRIYEAVERHRAALLTRERQAAVQMARAYQDVWASIDDAVAQALEARETNYWSAEYVLRMRALEEQVAAEAARFAEMAVEMVEEGQRAAAVEAQEHAARLARLSASPEAAAEVASNWSRLPREAVEDLAGFLSDGSPLRALIDGFGRQASEGFRSAVITGLAVGRNPRDVAAAAVEAGSVPLRRALLISRTEMLRAYRESTRRAYLENRRFVRAWQWACAHSARTCPACLAMDGSLHPLEERLDDHPNGRCAMVPVLYGEEPPFRESGEQWFERQPPGVQERVLGQAAFAAWREGAVRLRDFVGRRYSRDWGTTRYARSLRQILGPQEALRWRMVASRS